MAPGPTRNTIHRRVKENVNPSSIRTPRVRRRRSAMIPYMVWRDTVLLASQTRRNDLPKLPVVEEETTESIPPVTFVAHRPAEISAPDLEAEVSAPLQPQPQPESQPSPSPKPPMAQDEHIELNLPCEAVVDDRDTVSFDLPIDSLEDLEELRQYNSGNPTQMLAALASGEYHPPVLQHDRPIEFRWGDYTLPILHAMGRDQPPYQHGRGRTPATQEETASLQEDIQKWLAEERQAPLLSREQKLQCFIDQLKTEIPSVVSLVEDGLLVARSRPSLHKPAPSNHGHNAEPSSSTAPPTELTELDRLLLQSTQIDLITQIRDAARHLQNLTDQLVASETDLLH